MIDLSRAPNRFGRRSFLAGSAGAVAGAGVASTFAGHAVALADSTNDFDLLPLPAPIPGGLPVGLPPPFDLIHIFLPGPTDVTLPFSGLQLMGPDVEPTTLTDFKGSTALAFVIGTAEGSDGVDYGLEVDIRAFQGEYVAADGSTDRGSFALI